MKIRLAEQRDDAGIRSLLARTPTPGEVSLVTRHEPAFFDSTVVEGRRRLVLVGEKAGEVHGVAMATTRTVFVLGRPLEIGYLGTLRLSPEVRGTPALARGFRFLDKVRIGLGPVPFFLTSILEGNATAEAILPSGRAGLPTYRPLFRYLTHCLPTLPRPGRRPPRSLRIAPGEAPGEILAFLESQGPRRQFRPLYAPDDLGSPRGQWRDLQATDFLVVRDGTRIRGVLGMWDQSAFRQNVVVAYSPRMHLVQRGTAFLSPLLGTPSLPPVGRPLRSVVAAGIAVVDDDETVLGVLVEHALSRLRKRRVSFLLIGLAEHDPLVRAVQRFPHTLLASRIHAVHWGEGADLLAALALDPTPPMMELGCL